MYLCSSPIPYFPFLITFFHKPSICYLSVIQLKCLKCSNVTGLVWSLAAALRFIGVTGLRGLTCSNPDRPHPLLLNQPLRQMLQEVGSEGWPMKELAFYHWPMMLYLCLWLCWQSHDPPSDTDLDHHCGQTETETWVSLWVSVAKCAFNFYGFTAETNRHHTHQNSGGERKDEEKWNKIAVNWLRQQSINRWNTARCTKPRHKFPQIVFPGAPVCLHRLHPSQPPPLRSPKAKVTPATWNTLFPNLLFSKFDFPNMCMCEVFHGF